MYSSVWFSAIYILLFVSLIGCIIPRTWQFVGQLRGRPPAAPKRLTRLPAYTTWRTQADPEQVREAALALLKKHRFRAHVAGDAVAAEKGYLRELGNLVFHIALIVLLVAFASGQLYKSGGNVLMVEGDGFSNTLPMYDDFKSGSLFETDDLVPFSFDLKDFKGTYEASGPNRGTPRTYEAKIRYSVGAYGKEKATTVKVNKPLEIDGSKVYLVSHGYAPVVTVRDGKGKVVFHAPVALLPLDGNVSSQGVVKVMDGYRDAKGKKEQLGFQAFFVPTFDAQSGTMLSQFPALLNPLLAVNAYHGDLGVNSGIPQSVYQLDKKHMKAFKDGKGQLLKKLLKPGDTLTLPNGAGSHHLREGHQGVGRLPDRPGAGRRLGARRCRRRDPSVSPRPCSSSAAGCGCARRASADGVTVVEMAGLGRSESAKVPQELGDLAGNLYDQAPGAPDPDDDASNPQSYLPKGLRSDSRRRNQRTPREHQQHADLLVDGRLHPGLLRLHRRVAVRQPQQVGRTAAALTADRGRTAGAPAVTVQRAGGTAVLERPKVVVRSASGARDVPDGPGAHGGATRRATCTAGSPSPHRARSWWSWAVSSPARPPWSGAPWGNMYEFNITFSTVAVGVYLALLALKKNVRWLGLFLITTVLLDLGLAVTVLYTASDQLVPALHSYWLYIHVSTAIFCGAVFYVGAVATDPVPVQGRVREQAPGRRQAWLLRHLGAGAAARLRVPWTSSPTGSTRPCSRCGPSRSSRGRSGRATPGAPVLELGPEGDVVLHHLDRLRLLPARPRHGRLEGPQGRLPGPDRLRLLAVQLLRRQHLRLRQALVRRRRPGRPPLDRVLNPRTCPEGRFPVT